MLFLCPSNTSQTWWTESCSWFSNLTRRKIPLFFSIYDKIDFLSHIYYLYISFYIFIYIFVYLFFITYLLFIFIIYSLLFIYIILYIYYIYIIYYYYIFIWCYIYIIYCIINFIIYFIIYIIYLYYIIYFILLYYISFIIYISIRLMKTTQEMNSIRMSNNGNSCTRDTGENNRHRDFNAYLQSNKIWCTISLFIAILEANSPSPWLHAVLRNTRRQHGVRGS